MNEQPSNRWQEIINIWKQRPYLLNSLAGFIIGVLFFPLLNLMEKDTQGLLESLVPEGIGIVVTVLFIDTLYRRYERERETRELKGNLIRQLRSPVRPVAMNALHELNVRGWLQDGSLSGANLYEAKLEGAIFQNANLPDANLWYADLSNTDLRGCDLTGASLWYSNLSDADLLVANLSNTVLIEANLTNTRLVGANFSGATLMRANLTGSTFGKARFDENTRLPDGELWVEGRDMREFTHPEEWKAEQEAKANNT
jgi:hypothetical protein